MQLTRWWSSSVGGHEALRPFAQIEQMSIDVVFYTCTKWARRSMPPSSNVIMREVIVGVYVVHRLNPLRILLTLVSLHLIEVQVLMVPSLVHDGDDVYRHHGPARIKK